MEHIFQQSQKLSDVVEDDVISDRRQEITIGNILTKNFQSDEEKVAEFIQETNNFIINYSFPYLIMDQLKNLSNFDQIITNILFTVISASFNDYALFILSRLKNSNYLSIYMNVFIFISIENIDFAFDYFFFYDGTNYYISEYLLSIITKDNIFHTYSLQMMSRFNLDMKNQEIFEMILRSHNFSEFCMEFESFTMIDKISTINILSSVHLYNIFNKYELIKLKDILGEESICFDDIIIFEKIHKILVEIHLLEPDEFTMDELNDFEMFWLTNNSIELEDYIEKY